MLFSIQKSLSFSVQFFKTFHSTFLRLRPVLRTIRHIFFNYHFKSWAHTRSQHTKKISHVISLLKWEKKYIGCLCLHVASGSFIEFVKLPLLWLHGRDCKQKTCSVCLQILLKFYWKRKKRKEKRKGSVWDYTVVKTAKYLAVQCDINTKRREFSRNHVERLCTLLTQNIIRVAKFLLGKPSQ